MKIPLIFLLSVATAAAAYERPVDPALPAYVPQPVGIPAGARYVQADGAIRINGAEHAAVMVHGFNALFQKTHPGFAFAVQLKGTTTGMPLLTHGVTLFAPLGREVNGVELVPYAKIVGQAPVEIHVAHDSNVPGKFATNLAIYVNQANPLDRLTMEQVARIFARGHHAGDISGWVQLGVKGEWAKQPIHPYATPEASGFGDYMQKRVLAGRQLSARADQMNNTEELIKGVAGDVNGICLAAIGVANPAVKQIALAEKADGPYSTGSIEDITANRYPLGRYLYFYVRRVPGQRVDPVVKEYFRLILSQEGQRIIAAEANGYIPLTAAEAAAELAKLD
ncbi:MAG: substrate-binding domain-containing protein [Opitutaceae bacterium]